MIKFLAKKNILKIGLLVILIVAILGILAPGATRAYEEDISGRIKCPKGQITLQVPIPGLSKITGSGHDYCLKAERGFLQYIQALYNLFISIVGILAVIMIMAGGFQWLLAAGNAQKISGAKTTIISAVMGLVLALGSYTILGLINPALVNLTLTVSPVTTNKIEANKLCKKKDNPVLTVYDHKEPMCGYQYPIGGTNKSGDKSIEYCHGFTGCKNSLSGKLFGVKEGCLISNKHNSSCASWGTKGFTSNSKITIVSDDSSFGTVEWEAMIPCVEEDKKCGGLYVKKINSDLNNKENSFCFDVSCEDEERYCVIYVDNGAHFTKNWEKIEKGSRWQNVGKMQSSCEKW